jgi:hypothetical protein
MEMQKQTPVFETANSPYDVGSEVNAQLLTEKVTGVLHEAEEVLFEKLKHAELSLRESLINGSHDLDERKAQIDSVWHQSAIKHYAIKNPIMTASIALATGALIASLLRGD